MALPAALQTLFDRLQTYNSDAYNASTNPGGFARGGNQKPVDNFIKSVRDFTAFGKGISDLTSSAATDATTASTAAANAAQSKTDADTARDRAQEWANKPEDQVVAGGLYSALHWMKKAAAQVPLAAAEVAKAAAEVVKAATQADRSKAEADRSQGYAAGLNIPALNASTALQFLRANAAGSAYEFAAVDTYSASLVNRIARTSNTALAKADKGSLIDITSGTFTQTLVAAATLGAGWFVYIRNAGTGDITLDPNGSETIDGLASFIMYPGEARLVQCDGSAFSSIVLTAFSKTFTASGTFIKPPGYSYFSGMLWGGGGGGGFGGATSNYQTGGGGGGGACVPIIQKASTMQNSAVVVIGAGGAGATSVNFSGASGGASNFNTIFQAYGGGGGSQTYGGGGGGAMSFGMNNSSGGLPHVTINNSADDPGFGGANGFNSAYPGIPSGVSMYGGAGGGGNTNSGGSSYYGGCGGGGGVPSGSNSGGFSSIGGKGGNGGSASALPTNGSAPGGGGGGGYLVTGGAGARGQLDIWGVV